MKGKSRAMEFYRFVCAVLILCYHCNWYSFWMIKDEFSGFYLLVEMFFILSGFLMARGVRRNARQLQTVDPAEATAHYIKGRLRRFLPHHILSWVLVALIRILLLKNVRPLQVLEIGWPELLLVNIFGFVRGEYINIVCWYLSALVFSSLVVYFLLVWNENAYIKVIAPVLLAVCYGTLYDRAGSLAATILFTQYSPHLGFMRGLADMTVGCLAFRAFEWMEDVRFPNEDVWATVVEAAIFIACGLFMYRGWGKFDFLFVPLFFAFVISVFRGKSLFSRLFDNRLSEWLGKQSYAYFLNNFVVVLPYMYFFPETNVKAMCWFCVPVCLVVSVITGYGLDAVMAAGKKRKAA